MTLLRLRTVTRYDTWQNSSNENISLWTTLSKDVKNYGWRFRSTYVIGKHNDMKRMTSFLLFNVRREFLLRTSVCVEDYDGNWDCILLKLLHMISSTWLADNSENFPLKLKVLYNNNLVQFECLSYSFWWNKWYSMFQSIHNFLSNVNC